MRLAVAPMAGSAQNPPFQQGAKRTAFVAGLAVLQVNAVTLEDGVDSRTFADAFVAVIAHESDGAAFSELLRPHVVAYG